MANVTLHVELAAILEANGNHWMTLTELARTVNPPDRARERLGRGVLR